MSLSKSVSKLAYGSIAFCTNSHGEADDSPQVFADRCRSLAQTVPQVDDPVL
jgi:hypothetical protein